MEAVSELLGLPTPAENLVAALPSVQLTRAPGPPQMLVVTAQPAAQVAARYGVPAASVDALPRRPGERGRVLRVRLPLPAVARPPVLPRSVQPYTVRPGDSLLGVAAAHDLTLLDLLGANLDLSSLNALTPGETLLIPTRERGLLVRIKPGQSALSLIAGYGADLTATARANDVLPTALQPGDFLLLPGIRAQGYHQRLVQRREAREEAERRLAALRQYERFLTWKQERYEARLEQQYLRQKRYEAYPASQLRAERRRREALYARQAQYEAAQADLRARRQARAAAAPPTPLVARPAGVRVTAGERLAWPMRDFRLTSRYGERDIDFHKEVFHGGIDLAAPQGTPVYAAAPGTVTESGYGSYGMNVYTAQEGSTLIYGHLSRTAVAAGQRVQQGDLLGYVGCTGICTGPHLHFEVRLSGRAVDPLVLLP